LKTAVTLEPNHAEAHLQLGTVYAEQRKYAEAAAEYQRALEIAPNVAATHYRLGQAFARTGDKSRAQEEFVIYERLRNQEVTEVQKQNAEIQQFVYTMRAAHEGSAKRN
jgi:tetratricopeptide (TPR) repeat protein